MRFRLRLGVCLVAVMTVAQAQDDRFAEVRDQLTTCFGCHGENGVPVDPQYPILGGQEFYYLYVQLRDYQSGLRENPVMQPMVAALSKDQLKSLATYFSELTWPEPTGAEVSVEDERIAKQAISAGQCSACHPAALGGDSRIPRIAGQHVQYLQQTMLDFKTRTRNNAPDISTLLATLSDEEIGSLARYAAALP
jgi:cytochrome c553